MNLFKLLLKPLLPIFENAIDVEVDEKEIANLVLYLLGDEHRDSVTAAIADKAIKGGSIVEAVDGAIIESYIKQLRGWAENKIGE